MKLGVFLNNIKKHNLRISPIAFIHSELCRQVKRRLTKTSQGKKRHKNCFWIKFLNISIFKKYHNFFQKIKKFLIVYQNFQKTSFLDAKFISGPFKLEFRISSGYLLDSQFSRWVIGSRWETSYFAQTSFMHLFTKTKKLRTSNTVKFAAFWRVLQYWHFCSCVANRINIS